VELKKIPYADWQEKYDKLMTDPYLSKKYNRKKRIKAKRAYMTNQTPEIKRCKGKLILDIGPGPGEWLELCREFGHDVIGIDAKFKDCEMGSEYIHLSNLMTDRQKIPLYYIGFEWYLYLMDQEKRVTDTPPIIKDESVFYINSQGSIEQCFKDYMTGPPHRETKKSSLLSWVVDNKLRELFKKMFTEFERILEPGGFIFIWANGSANNPEYDNLILETLKQFDNLDLYRKDGKLVHKIRKSL